MPKVIITTAAFLTLCNYYQCIANQFIDGATFSFDRPLNFGVV